MTREEFDDLVHRVEKRYADRPGALRWLVVLLAAIGYASLLAWLSFIILISAGFFGLMFWAEVEAKIACAILGTIILFGGGYAVLSALLVRVPHPEGRPVTRKETPALFRVLDELQAELNSQPFHKVLIEPDCNAAVVQVPRLGFFGWQRNYLLIGMPLLEGLSRDQMRAVLAHEFTHLSREHGRMTHWLYRLRRSWQEIFNQLSRPQVRSHLSLRPLVIKFVHFFWPRFNAHAFVLSRANEYEADAMSARLTGAQNAASALLRVSVVSSQMEERLWPDIFRLANENPEPPGNVFEKLREEIRSGFTLEDGAKWIAERLKMASTNSDTHPCLTERLQALKVAPGNSEAPPDQSAAEALLGSALPAIRDDVQKHWSKQIRDKWRDRHARANALKHRLSSIDQAPVPAMDVDRLWDKAAALLDLEGAKTAIPLLRQIVEARPSHAPAQFHLGRLLLDDSDSAGITNLEQAMELDENCTPQACSILHNYYRFAGQSAQLRELDARMDRYEQALKASHAERSSITAKDTFIEHGLGDAELQALRAELQPELRIVRAHLARKELKHFPRQRLFVLCVHPCTPWHGFSNGDLDRALVNRLMTKVKLPGRLMILTPSGKYRSLARKLTTVPSVEIFTRQQS